MNRVKIYVNGTEVDGYDTSSAPAQNLNTFVNDMFFNTIGLGTSYNFISVMMVTWQKLIFLMVCNLDASSFGYTDFQTKTWRPKKYSGSYNTNGFRLDFSDNSAATAMTLGKDEVVKVMISH